MRIHRIQSFLLSVGLLVMLVACADPTKDKPAAKVDQPVAKPASTAGKSYLIGPKSSVGFVGSKVTGSHEGGFREFRGSITAGSSPESSSVEVEIDTTSLFADDDRLTNHLKSPDFFDVEQFPSASFASTAIAAEGEAYRVTGNLDLHGVRKSISFPATIEMSADGVSAHAEFSIKRFDFNIEYKGKADDLIRDDVLIKLHLVAAAEAETEADEQDNDAADADSEG